MTETPRLCPCPVGAASGTSLLSSSLSFISPGAFLAESLWLEDSAQHLTDPDSGFLGEKVAAGCESSLGFVGVVGGAFRGDGGWPVCGCAWISPATLRTPPFGCCRPGSLRTSLCILDTVSLGLLFLHRGLLCLLAQRGLPAWSSPPHRTRKKL